MNTFSANICGSWSRVNENKILVK